LSNTPPDLGGVAARVLGPYLGLEGFEATVTERARAEFTKGELLLRISYLAEEGSPRGLNVGLGFAYSDGSTETVGLWALVPAGADRGFEAARFVDENELEGVLERLRDEALCDWTTAYWRHPDRLVTALQDAAVQRDEQHQRAVDERQLHEARKAFASGNFQEAVDRYAMAGGELSSVDVQRLKVARRSLESG